jgi:hypothetical protein
VLQVFPHVEGPTERVGIATDIRQSHGSNTCDAEAVEAEIRETHPDEALKGLAQQQAPKAPPPGWCAGVPRSEWQWSPSAADFHAKWTKGQTHKGIMKTMTGWRGVQNQWLVRLCCRATLLNFSMVAWAVPLVK